MNENLPAIGTFERDLRDAKRFVLRVYGNLDDMNSGYAWTLAVERGERRKLGTPCNFYYIDAAINGRRQSELEIEGYGTGVDCDGRTLN